jgi:fatty-acyl-CoA synthase
VTDNGLGSWPRRRAAMTPGKTALVQDGVLTTYAQLERATTRLAHGLRARGVSRADRVAFLGLNSVEMVIAMFATARLGAVFVPLNTRLAPPELGHLLEHSAAVLLLVEDPLAATAGQARADRSGPATVVFTRTAGSGLDALMAKDDSTIDEPIGLYDLFMIQYTSGTSGLPKGVMLTHGNVIWNVYNLLVDIDIDLGSDETRRACWG